MPILLNCLAQNPAAFPAEGRGWDRSLCFQTIRQDNLAESSQPALILISLFCMLQCMGAYSFQPSVVSLWVLSICTEIWCRETEIRWLEWWSSPHYICAASCLLSEVNVECTLQPLHLPPYCINAFPAIKFILKPLFWFSVKENKLKGKFTGFLIIMKKHQLSTKCLCSNEIDVGNVAVSWCHAVIEIYQSRSASM